MQKKEDEHETYYVLVKHYYPFNEIKRACGTKFNNDLTEHLKQLFDCAFAPFDEMKAFCIKQKILIYNRDYYFYLLRFGKKNKLSMHILLKI